MKRGPNPLIAERNRQRALNIAGMRSGRLVAISPSPVNSISGERQWICKCDCGNTHMVRTWYITHQQIVSCGCIRGILGRELQTKHGAYSDPVLMRTYRIWCGMIQRCYYKKHKSYKNYGGRGIRVCREWRDFRNFYADMGARPSDKVLERKNNSLGYSADNCCWATHKEQANNRRSNRKLILNGVSMNLEQWAQRLGIESFTLGKRLRKGWSVKKTLTTPLKIIRSRRRSKEASRCWYMVQS